MVTRVEKYLVAYACQVLQGFCDKHNIKMDPASLAEFAIAWREGDTFEWTPCAEAFRRIIAVRPQEDNSRKYVALVFGSDDLDRKLSHELNDAIFAITNNRWI